MTRPNFNDITLPLLQLLADGKIHSSRDLHKRMDRYFQRELTGLRADSSQEGPIDLGKHLRLARARLQQACLLQRLSRRRCRLTSMGQNVFRQNPQTLDAYLVQPPAKAKLTKKSQNIGSPPHHLRDLKEKDSRLRGNDVYRSQTNPRRGVPCGLPSQLFGAKNHNPIPISMNGSPQGTPLQNGNSLNNSFPMTINPEEALRANYQNLRQTLAADIQEKIKRVSPAFFEQLVVDVLVAMGYGGSRIDAAETLGRRGDGGVDGIIKEDKL